MPSIALPVSLRGQLLSGIRSAVAVFSPIDLFATGSQGIWLDPSDLTTMFADRAGTTAVVTPGTVVGLRLDKSKGLALGSELVTNGGPNFASSTGWSLLNDTTVNVVGGDFEIVRGAGTGQIAQSFATVVGKTYKISATVRRGTASSFTVSVGNGETGSSIYTSGTRTDTAYTEIVAYFAAASTTTWVRIGIGGTVVGSTVFADNISVRELAGNHATAPTDAARPIYGVEPKGGRRNLLTYSEDFRNTAAAGETRPWFHNNANVSANTTLSPTGTLTADTMTGTGSFPFCYQDITASVGSTVSGSFWLRKTTGLADGSLPTTSLEFRSNTTLAEYSLVLNTNSGVAIASSGWGTAPALNASMQSDGDYWRVLLSSPAAPAATTTARLYIGASGGFLNGTRPGSFPIISIIIWGAQLELGSTATNYQRVLSAYDVTESGVPTCHYVQFDGSDDSMSTAAIDFTATDKMSVFAGVRKNSDALTGMLVELSANAGSFGGAFYLVAPSPPTNAYEVASRGFGGVANVGVALASFPAPAQSILTMQGDISGDTLKLRVNGTQVAQSTADQGTGNFSTYPLYIGRRNNATLPFNGKDYGIIIVGKLASAGEITDTETWLAAKTSGVTI